MRLRVSGLQQPVLAMVATHGGASAGKHPAAPRICAFGHTAFGGDTDITARSNRWRCNIAPDPAIASVDGRSFAVGTPLADMVRNGGCTALLPQTATSFGVDGMALCDAVYQGHLRQIVTEPAALCSLHPIPRVLVFGISATARHRNAVVQPKQ